MKKIAARIGSILLCVVLCLSLMPAVAFAEVYYDLIVDGKLVTSQNMNNILGDIGTPTASYNPYTQILTLNNYNGGYIFADMSLNIVLAKGSSNQITSSTFSGISTTGDCLLSGKGNLTIQNTSDSSFGISAQGNLKLNLDGTVKINTLESCIVSSGECNVNGMGTLTLQAADVSAYGILAAEDVNINRYGSLSINSPFAGISAENIEISGSGEVSVISDEIGLSGNDSIRLTRTSHVLINVKDVGILTDNNVEVEDKSEVSIQSGFEGVAVVKGGYKQFGNSKVSVSAQYGIITGSGNIEIDDSGELSVITDVNGLVVYAGDLLLSGSSNVTVTAGTKGVQGTGNVKIFENAKIEISVEEEGFAVYLKESGKSLLLNGTGAPIKLSTVSGYPAVYNEADGTSPVSGTNLSYYNKVTGAPNQNAVVYDHAANEADALPFVDVLSNQWFYSSVAYVYHNGLMNGISKDTFEPNSGLTRGMFVTILGRMAGVDQNSYKNTSFSDVKTGQWYSPYVEWAKQNNITHGIGDGQFGVNQPVNREQMATFISRYVNAMNIVLPDAENPVSGFKDAGSVSSWAREGLELMRKSGIIRGDTEGNFRPFNSATRAEAATIFMRLDSSIKNS